MIAMVNKGIKFNLELENNILKYAPNMDSRKYLTEFKTYCNKIKPLVSQYNNLIKSYNATAYNILEGEIKALLPQLF